MQRSTYIACILVVAVLFSVGLHNIDNAQNLLRVNADVAIYGMEYQEVSLYGKHFDYNQAYALGLWLVASSGILLTFFSLVGGMVWQK